MVLKITKATLEKQSQLPFQNAIASTESIYTIAKSSL